MVMKLLKSGFVVHSQKPHQPPKDHPHADGPITLDGEYRREDDGSP
jgi:hypothetical protein